MRIHKQNSIIHPNLGMQALCKQKLQTHNNQENDIV